jgi:CheY-like chemotaxis protein
MSRPIILAADDSVTVRKLIEISLKADEFELHFAVDGKECLAKANALKPALLLLDYILPDMKGVDICHALLNRPETRDIPVLLISGNGAAIRQTYENAGNVADYLTKPFAPNVLNAVVGHLIADSGRKKNEAAAEQELAANAVVSPTAVPTAEPQCAIPENLRTKVFQNIVAALHAPLMAFPGLEAGRENEPAAEYFLDFLKASGAIERLCRDLVAMPELKPAPVHLRCHSELAPIDRVLIHLKQTGANGLLRVELVDEVIQFQLDAGEIIFITSNNPKRYCAKAAFPFRSLPQSAIAIAVAEQQKHATPFFVTLQKQGALPPGTNLAALLQFQGAAALARAMKAAVALFTFEESAGIATDLRPFRQRYSMSGLLLAAYRTVEDWLTIEAAIPGFDLVFQRNTNSSYRPGELTLDAFESEMLSLMDGTRTVQDLVTFSRQSPFDLCRRLFPLVRLGLVTPAKAAVIRPTADRTADIPFTNGRIPERGPRLADATFS